MTQSTTTSLDPEFFDPLTHKELAQDTRYGPLPCIDNPKTMTIIVGVPRSGTSLCTLIFNKAGFRVFGDKWPKTARENQQINPDEKFWMKQCREYMRDKQEPPEIREHREQKTKDMNRSGFWEDGRFSVRGLNYNLNTRKLIHDIQSSKRPPVGKIVCQGLPTTDPSLIGRIIYTIRDPHKVAKSQERLKRGPEIMVDGMPMDITEELKIHTPEMYIRVTYQACKWILANPDVPIYFYNYDDLIDNPEKILTEMDQFLQGEIGDQLKEHDIDIVKAGMEVIEPSSRRSTVEDIPNNLWEEAEFIYKKFCEGADGRRESFLEIVEYMERIDEREIHKQARQWSCYRLGGIVNEDKCAACRAKPSHFIKNTVEQLKYSFIDWTKEPCMAEVGMSKNIAEEDYITIEESIENNFWVDAVEELTDIPFKDIHTKLIHKPFIKKTGPKGERLIHKISEEALEEIITYISQGIPPEMLAGHLDTSELSLVNFLRAKLGRFHYSAILQRMTNNENHALYTFEYQVGKFFATTQFTSEQHDELKGFLKSVITDIEKKEVENALIESKSS